MSSVPVKAVAWGKPRVRLDHFIELWRKALCSIPKGTFILTWYMWLSLEKGWLCHTKGRMCRICVLCQGRIIWYHNHIWYVAPACTFLKGFPYKNERCFVSWGDCSKRHWSLWSNSSPLLWYIYFFFEENVSSTLLLSLENNMAFFEPRYYSFSKICEKVHHFLHSGST